MKAIPFLRDINDEKHYAQLLEVAYCEAATELNHLCQELIHLCHEESFVTIERGEVVEITDKLSRLQWVMIGTVGDSTERRRRLAHVPGGLADVVTYEERSKE